MILRIIIICIITFTLSSICGYYRFRFKKLSFYWFLFIHLPVPFIYALRIIFDLDLLSSLPFTIPCYALGQWLGMRYAKNKSENKIKSK